MSSGIYKLTFNCGLEYIGQSINIEDRFKDHCKRLKSKSHTNLKLLQLFMVEDHFPSLEILEIVHNTDILFDREKYWISKLDTYKNGLNLTEGDRSCFGQASPASKYTDSQYYSVLEKLAITDDTLKQVSEDTGVSLAVINNMIGGKSQLNLAILYPDLYQLMDSKRGIRKLKYCKDKYIEILQSLLLGQRKVPEIARNLEVTLSTVHGVLEGKYKFLNQQEVDLARSMYPKHPQNKNVKDLVLISPEGVEFQVTSTQKEFAIEHSISRSGLSQLLSGKLSSCNGWTLV